MADAAAKPEKRIRNVIHDDAIWRQTINYELHTAKNWEKLWGFTKNTYRKKTRVGDSNSQLQQQQQQEGKNINSNSSISKLPPIVTKHKNGSGLPSKLHSQLTNDPDNSIVSDWLSNYQIPRIIQYRFPASKYTFPSTTATEVGWPWGRASEYGCEENVEKTVEPDGSVKVHRKVKSKYVPKWYTLEKYGSHARGKNENLKWYGGTMESLP